MDRNCQDHRRRLAEFAERANEGKINCVLDIVLNANASTTTVIDPRIGPFTAILFSPLTASASLSFPPPYAPLAEMSKGAAVIHHTNDISVDKVFRLVLLG